MKNKLNHCVEHRGVLLAHEGECGSEPAGCACQPILSPVCGLDDVTYDNECELKCQ